MKKVTHVIRTISVYIVDSNKFVYSNKQCRIGFGTCTQVHEDGDNSLRPRTLGELALHPTGNERGALPSEPR